MRLNQKSPAVFYGWWIVGAGFLINLFTAGAVFFGFTAFFEPIAEEFGWSYAQVSLAASIRGLEMGVFAPVAGLAVDRYGPRRLVSAGALFIGLGLVLLSRVSNLAMFYLAFVLITIGVSACVGVVTISAVGHWFRRKASLAIGITMSGTAIGGLMVPLITLLIDVFGWRTAVFSLGLGVCVLILVLSPLLRHKPEQYGYLPDGAVEDLPTDDQAIYTAKVPDTKQNMGVRQVLATRTFWQMAVAFSGFFLGLTAVTTHVMPYFSSIGIARATSSLLASALPVVSIFGRLGVGWLGDKVDKKWLTVVAFIAITLGILLFGGIASVGIWLCLPFVILFSIGWGGIAVMLPVLIRTYFGRSSFGIALGLAMFITSVGQILGPTLAGWAFDVWGSYIGAWFAFAILVFVATIIMATTPQITAKY